jgi:hypothetical protein
MRYVVPQYSPNRNYTFPFISARPLQLPGPWSISVTQLPLSEVQHKIWGFQGSYFSVCHHHVTSYSVAGRCQCSGGTCVLRLTLKMKAVHSSKTPASSYKTIQCHNQKKVPCFYIITKSWMLLSCSTNLWSWNIHFHVHNSMPKFTLFPHSNKRGSSSCVQL